MHYTCRVHVTVDGATGGKRWPSFATRQTIQGRNLANVSLSFLKRRDAVRAQHGVFAGVVGRERERHIAAEEIQQIAQISRSTLEVFDRVGHPEAPGRRGNKLHQAYGAFGRDCAGIVFRFNLDDGVDQGRIYSSASRNLSRHVTERGLGISSLPGGQSTDDLCAVDGICLKLRGGRRIPVVAPYHGIRQDGVDVYRASLLVHRSSNLPCRAGWPRDNDCEAADENDDLTTPTI